MAHEARTEEKRLSAAWRRISEGERNLAITRLAGLLFSRLNRTPHLAAELVLAWNATHCSPPLDEEEVWRTIESIAQREAQKLRGLPRI